MMETLSSRFADSRWPLMTAESIMPGRRLDVPCIVPKVTQNAERCRGIPGCGRSFGERRLDGGCARRNDRVRSGVITEAVEDSLIHANQTQLAGDNLVSVNGAEEDGVDNRVEAPSRTPGEGSGSASSSEGSEAAAGDTGGRQRRGQRRTARRRFRRLGPVEPPLQGPRQQVVRTVTDGCRRQPVPSRQPGPAQPPRRQRLAAGPRDAPALAGRHVGRWRLSLA